VTIQAILAVAQLYGFQGQIRRVADDCDRH
jgi:hypothetical protein